MPYARPISSSTYHVIFCTLTCELSTFVLYQFCETESVVASPMADGAMYM